MNNFKYYLLTHDIKCLLKQPSQHPTTTTVTFRIQSCGLACPQGYTGSQPLDGCTGYVGCDNGVAKEPIACPPGLLYDENLGYCNFPDSVTCNCGTSLPPSTQTPTVKPSLLPNDSPRIISVTVVEPGGGLKTVNCCDDGGFDECSVLLSIGQVEVEECPSAPPPTISMAPSTSPPSTSPTTRKYECFGANDGGSYGILYNAVRSYVSEGCATYQECPIAQKYGWPINSWCVGNVKDMSKLFQFMVTFNENISGWNTSSVTDMTEMFFSATSFNEDISDWNTSSVTDMGWMFRGASSFNHDLSNFNTSSVTTMDSMFNGATVFNGDVSSFDTSSVTDMGGMFYGASSFNQDVSNFDITSVTDMWLMFDGASLFNQDLCSWRDSFPYTNAYQIFTNSNCTYQDTPNKTQKGPFCASNCQ